MKPSKVVLLLCAAVVAATCAQSPPAGPTDAVVESRAAVDGEAQVAGQGPGPTPMTAVVQFGKEGTGSPFPPGSGHDQSAHAPDSLVPGTVVIQAGGTVTFEVPAGVHQIGIYEPGTSPADIDVTDVTTLAAFAGCADPPDLVNAPLVIDILDDPTLEAAYPLPCFTPASVTHQFDQPGRYLVMCNFLPHFEVKMYGWVIVRE